MTDPRYFPGPPGQVPQNPPGPGYPATPQPMPGFGGQPTQPVPPPGWPNPYGPPGPPPMGPYLRQAPPRRRPPTRHTGRTIVLSIAGAIVGLIVIGVAASGGKNLTANSGATPAAKHQARPQHTATSPLGHARNGAGHGTKSAVGQSASASKVLLSLTGTGIRNSRPFNVGGKPLTVTYSFNCSSFGSSGNFAADLLYGNQSSLNSDDLTIANALARSGHQTTVVYPQYPGRDYYLAVNSECAWTVKVKSGS